MSFRLMWSTLHVHRLFARPVSILVADIYQSYGGPCKALEAKLRAIKNTLGDPLLLFVVVSPRAHDRFRSCFPVQQRQLIIIRRMIASL